MEEGWGSEHGDGEEQIAFDGSAEKRYSGYVGHEHSLECLGIHIRSRPSGEVAQQEKRN
jgi:hypothetical protein